MKMLLHMLQKNSRNIILVRRTSWSVLPSVYANDEAGYIVRQKGKQKYLVTGGTTGLTAQRLSSKRCKYSIVSDSMRILATYANSATQTVQYLSDHNAGLFTANLFVATANIVSRSTRW